jgi:hypothetical protein
MASGAAKKKKKGGQNKKQKKAKNSSPGAGKASTTHYPFDPSAVEFHAHDREFELGVAVVRNFLSTDECALVRTTSSMPGSVKINDRHDELNFKHQVWRIEGAATASDEFSAMLTRCLATISSVDNLYWRKLSRTKAWHPEVELIKYQVTAMDRELPGIGPHVDNSSVITFVCMLSEKQDYDGGLSCFEDKDKAPRVLTLQLGDAVMFRGEKTEHWITDVAAGCRVILQIECCRAKAGRH